MELTGILLVNKPEDFTSFDVVAKVRGIVRQRHIGHSGTLDPMVTGVLPLFLGRAAKAISLLPRQDKSYRGQFQLGVITDTQDVTGAVLAQNPVQVEPKTVEQVAETFRGKLMQIPPMYSAVKIGGEKLCDLAREGKTVERQPRPVEIYDIACSAADPERHLYDITVHCSGGTYIRTLVHDIGRHLGCGAVLTQLERTMASGFPLCDCVTLEELQKRREEDRLSEAVLPVETAFRDLPEVVLPGKEARLLFNGVKLRSERVAYQGEPGLLRAKDISGHFLGLLAYSHQEVKSRLVLT